MLSEMSPVGHTIKLVLVWVALGCGERRPVQSSVAPDHSREDEAAADPAPATPHDSDAPTASGVSPSVLPDDERSVRQPRTSGSASSAPQHPAEADAWAAERAELPQGTRVLHIGDSFAGALGYELNREFAERGVEGFLEHEKATYIPTWAWSKELPRYLARYRPDLVLITLGGNELQITDPEQRAETVRRLVGRLGGRPCVWVGIPLWPAAKPELLGVIERNVAPCLFLDSNTLLPDLPRAKDGVHPTLGARRNWAQAVVGWLEQQQSPKVTDAWHWRTQPEPASGGRAGKLE